MLSVYFAHRKVNMYLHYVSMYIFMLLSVMCLYMYVICEY